jgi:hypothetical protein
VVYQHLTAAAEQMFAVIMPDQAVNRRRLAQALSKQTSPLCSEVESQLRHCPEYDEHERAKAWADSPVRKIDDLLGAKQQPPKPSPIHTTPAPRWSTRLGERQDGQEMDAPWHYATPEEEDAYRDYILSKKNPKRWAEEQALRREWAEEDKRRAAADLKAHYQEERAKKQAARKAKAQEAAKANAAPAEATPTEAKPTAPPPACGLAPTASPLEVLAALAAATPPTGGIMSPKMSFCDKTHATKCDATENPTTESAAERAEADLAGTDDKPQDDGDGEPSTFRALLERFRSRRQREPSDALKRAS